MEGAVMFDKDTLCRLVCVNHQAFYFVVNCFSGLFTVIPVLRKFTPQKYLFFFFAKHEGPQGFTHSPFTDHLSGHIRGAFNIIPGACRHVIENQFLGSSSTHQDCQITKEICAGVSMFFVNRKLLGQSERPPTGDNRHFVNRVGAGNHSGDKRMPCFMVCGVSFFFITDDHALALGPHHDLVFRLFEIRVFKTFLVVTRGKKRCLINEILEVRAGKSRGSAGNHREIHIIGNRHLFGMDLEYAFPTLYVRHRHQNLSVKASRTEERRVQNIRTVGGGNQYNPLV